MDGWMDGYFTLLTWLLTVGNLIALEADAPIHYQDYSEATGIFGRFHLVHELHKRAFGPELANNLIEK